MCEDKDNKSKDGKRNDTTNEEKQNTNDFKRTLTRLTERERERERERESKRTHFHGEDK